MIIPKFISVKMLPIANLIFQKSHKSFNKKTYLSWNLCSMHLQQFRLPTLLKFSQNVMGVCLWNVQKSTKKEARWSLLKIYKHKAKIHKNISKKMFIAEMTTEFYNLVK
jgi:hypothetical protein